MIKSMTGYGSAKAVVDGLEISVELKSVNNRYLDTSVRIPRSFLFAEEAIKSRIQSHISRGKVDVFVNSNFIGRRIDVLLSRTDPYFNVDFGLSTDLFDRHLSLYFKVNDLFHSSNTHTVSTNPYYAEDYSWSYNSRFVSLGLTWRIGKLDLERKGRQGAAY